MRILILGGTVFLSAELVRQALLRGHEVTALARGTAGLPPSGARFVRADRSAGPGAYAELDGDGDWDAVIDVAREPEQVRGALDALAERTRHWTFVSSCSVYAGHDVPGADESDAVLPPLEAGQGGGGLLRPGQGQLRTARGRRGG